jgi:uncharacterized secreted repeat protein (TIGR03808 family)
MTLNRRQWIAGAAIAGAALSTSKPASAGGLDAAQFGVRPNAADDQSAALQRAIDQAAASRTPLALVPGIYRASELNLPTGIAIFGVRGATKLVLSRGASLLSARAADTVTLSGLVLDGGALRGGNAALVDLTAVRGLRITDCDILRAGGIALKLTEVEGRITGNSILDSGEVGLHSVDARGLTISGNTVRGAGNGGIHVWRSQKGEDGTLVADNRIEDIRAVAGGSGQNGNAINVYRAGGVIVRGNHIRNAAFTAVRGNAASNIQIVANACSMLGEVAIYSEFDFQGAVISGNTIDDAALGVSITNFKEGGRLSVVQGNLIRNITRRRPAGTDPNDGWGIGIGVEADTAVTGNVIENAAMCGISAGWGEHLRDVAITGNVIRQAPAGIAVSVAPGAGAAVIANNQISGAPQGAVVGVTWTKIVSADLARDAARFPQVSVSGNQVR